MHPKIVATHSSPFKVDGVRDLLERIAALDCVARVIPGRMRHIGGNSRLRLADAGMPAGQSGRKYTVLSAGTSIELFVVPVDGRLDEVEAALATLPEYSATGNTRRAAEAAAAAARAARLAEARRHHGPRPRQGG
jgi:hypothetical protein